jgi:hypothetical protein
MKFVKYEPISRKQLLFPKGVLQGTEESESDGG